MKDLNLNDMQLVTAAGWTIIHSFWQFAVLSAFFKTVSILLSGRSSALRYRLGMFTLVAALFCSAFTFSSEYYSISEHYSGRLVESLNRPNSQRFTDKVTAAVMSEPSGNYLIDFLNMISPFLTLIWLIGMVFYIIRLAYGSGHLQRIRKSETLYYPALSEKLADLVRRMNISKRVTLKISDAAAYPLTFGAFKTVLFLPASLILQIPPAQLEMILAHELAHIKRHDYFINLIQTLFDGVFFFNPFFRQLSEAVREEREYCCDDMAAMYCGDGRTMAVALTNLKILKDYPQLSLASSPVKNSFQQRIYRLVDPEQTRKFSVKTLLLTALSLCLIFALTKCSVKKDGSADLPAVSDSLQQVLGDNQAGSRIEVLNYDKAGIRHDLFVVSTTEGSPKYAYLDGKRLSDQNLDSLSTTLKKKKTVPQITQVNEVPDEKDRLNDRMWRLSSEVDSLTKLRSKITPASGKDAQALQRNLDEKNKELKEVSMAQYKIDVAKIPSQVKIHELLTEIIKSGYYTAGQRQELNSLIAKNK